MVQDTMVLIMDLVTDDDDGSINDVSNYGFWYFLYEEVLFGIITWDL
jgi:spore coat protein CotH